MFSTTDLLDLLPKFDRLSVVTEGRFSEVLPIADLLVSFYSATVEEALQNQIPVLLYGGRGRYMHLPATPISSSARPEESAVYFVAEEKYLKPAIHHILDIHGRRPLDRRLLKPHCFERDEIIPLHQYVGGWIR